LNTELKRWGYLKNIKRAQAVAIVRERDLRKAEGRTFDFTIQSRPVDLLKVERHAQRAGIQTPSSHHHLQNLDPRSTQVACVTPPPTTSVSLLREERWRIPERLLFDIDHLIKGSFEAGLWSWSQKDQIINSSSKQSEESNLIHTFLGGLTSGCEAADVNDFHLARSFWQKAFESVDRLVQGQYHDIIPNLIQKINDLNREGREDLARMLHQHIAECGQLFLKPDSSTAAIYTGLGKLEITHMVAIEDRIMKRFKELFEFYLGPLSYNSFVMMMNHARRSLYRDEWVRFEDVLPPIYLLDSTFGISDRRTLDVIALRIDVAQKRKQFSLVESEAAILISRAEIIQNDRWQRFYNLTRGWFRLGCAQYFLRKKDEAITSLNNALANDDALRTLGDWNIYDPQRITIGKYLQDMQDWP